MNNRDKRNINILYNESWGVGYGRLWEDEEDNKDTWPFKPNVSDFSKDGVKVGAASPGTNEQIKVPRRHYREQYPWIFAYNIPWWDIQFVQNPSHTPRVLHNNNKIRRREVALPAWLVPYIKIILSDEYAMHFLKSNQSTAENSNMTRLGNYKSSISPILDMSRCQILALLYYMGANIHNIQKNGSEGYLDFDRDQVMNDNDIYHRTIDKIRETGWDTYDKGGFTGHSQEYLNAIDNEPLMKYGPPDDLRSDPMHAGQLDKGVEVDKTTGDWTPVDLRAQKVEVDDPMKPPDIYKPDMQSNYCDEKAIMAILGPRRNWYDRHFGWNNYNNMDQEASRGAGLSWLYTYYLPKLPGVSSSLS
jgi:hypothetical protein